MSARKKASALPATPQIVGTIHSYGSLKRAIGLKPGDVDVLELRVDHFADDPAKLYSAALKLEQPCIVTVRHPKEGGANGLSVSWRRELYIAFMDVAAFIDVELQSVDALADVLQEARRRGICVIVSDHHFKTTPSLAVLKDRVTAAGKAKADIIKLAATANRPADLARLFDWFVALSPKEPLSTMGMGAFGKTSRLLFARAGSLLNYGYLHQAQVPGQWEATTLKRRVFELNADS